MTSSNMPNGRSAFVYMTISRNPWIIIILRKKSKNAFTDIDRTQKNTELVKASRPVMTEKFFHDLLHYPGEDPATHLSQYLKYLDLRSDYDFLTY